MQKKHSDLLRKIKRLTGALSGYRTLILIEALGDEELCVGDIATSLGREQTETSLIISAIRKTNILNRRRDGKKIFYSLNRDALDKYAELSKLFLEVGQSR